VCPTPRWAKLSPNVGFRLPEIAAAAQAAGAEAVTLVNTYFGLVIDPVSAKPVLGGGAGGVSGPAIRPLAVRAVADVRRHCPDLPIIGVGGIRSAEDVVQFARAGADAVQVGTSTLADPRLVGRLAGKLNTWCDTNGVRAFRDLINTVEL